jgi:predicted small integral membrane protein
MEEETIKFTGDKKISLKETIVNIWRSRTFQITVDVCRILLVILLVLILYKLITEIEAVKILAYDVCRLCENKTGASCYIGNAQSYARTVYPSYNYSLNFTTG